MINPEKLLTSKYKSLLGRLSYYKLNGISITHHPHANASGQTYISNQQAPPGTIIPCHTADQVILFESNSGKDYSTALEMYDNPRSKIFDVKKPFSIYRKVNPTMDILNTTGSATNNIILRPHRNPWVSTSNLDYTYGRIFTAPFIVNMKSVMEQYLSFSIRLYITAKYVD